MKWTAEGSHINAAKAILLVDEAEELLVKRRKAENLDGAGEDVPEDRLYRRQKGYTNHIKKRQEVPEAMRVGLQRNTNTTWQDCHYQPDVCRDYKGEFRSLSSGEKKRGVLTSHLFRILETGCCGFGDTCKFLHDRGTCE